MTERSTWFASTRLPLAKKRPRRIAFVCRLHVAIHRELIGVRSQPQRVAILCMWALWDSISLVNDEVGPGAAHVADGAANEGDLFDLHCSLANEVISINRGRTLFFA